MIRVKRLISIILFIIAVIAVAFLTIPVGSLERRNGTVIMTFLINGFLWLTLTILEINKHPYSFKLIHWVFCLFFMFFAAFTQYAHNSFPWVEHRSDDTLITANLLLLLWTVGVCIGSLLSGRRKRKNKKSFSIREWHGFEILIPILMIISVLNTIYRVREIGIINLLARATSNVSTGSTQSVAMLIGHSLQACTYFAAVLSLLYWKRNKKMFLCVVVTVICLLISYFPAGTSRYTAAGIYVGILLTYSNRLKKNRWFIFLFLAAFMVVLPFLNAFRNTAFLDVSFKDALNQTINELSDIWLEGDYDAYSMFTLTIEYVQRRGIAWGRQFMGVLLFWVPRAFWPEKPVGSGYTVGTDLSWSFKNVSCPLPGEGYINFGTVGVLLFAILIGYIISRIDNAYWQTADTTGQKIRRIDLIYHISMTFFFFMSRGDLMSSFAYMMAYFAIWFILTRMPNMHCQKGILYIEKESLIK